MTDLDAIAPPVPLLSGWKEGEPALWCVHCGLTWSLPAEDDETASATRRAMIEGVDHLKAAHGWTEPVFDD